MPSLTRVLVGLACVAAFLGSGCSKTATHTGVADGSGGSGSSLDAGPDAELDAGGAGGIRDSGAGSGGCAGSTCQDGCAGASCQDDGAGDAGCYRDPYLPDNYQPPCDQPVATPSCTGGWCTIEPGCFFMGSPWCEWGRGRDTDNPLQVTLTHRFRIQQLELTQGEWTTQGLPNPSGLMANGTGDCIADNCPLGNVTWFEALAFANLLSRNEGLTECYVLTGCTGATNSSRKPFSPVSRPV